MPKKRKLEHKMRQHGIKKAKIISSSLKLLIQGMGGLLNYLLKKCTKNKRGICFRTSGIGTTF